MDVIGAKIKLKKIRFSLVFFCAILLFTNCGEQKRIEHLKVNYKNGQAVAVSFKARKPITDLEVFIAGSTANAVLGELKTSENNYQFIPVIPFSKGQQYEIRSNGTVLTSFAVELPDKEVMGELMFIYPTRDTVPENLLKIYLQFAQPMQQVGEVLDFVTVKDETTGEAAAVFLELESELWNKNHDRLTLWLDPGRIKTDLIPNREKGLPILKGREYTLHISRDWKTAQRVPLKKDYTKKLVVTARDNKRPNPENWEILTPTAGKKGELQIIFKEPMDAVLAMETLTIKDAYGQLVSGDFELGDHEKSILFKPANIWNIGNYNVLIKVKLEDLAGNNLNRLFDEDLKLTNNKTTPRSIYELSFRILQ